MTKYSHNEVAGTDQIQTNEILLIAIEELEAIVAPGGSFDRLSANHNETFVADRMHLAD